MVSSGVVKSGERKGVGTRRLTVSVPRDLAERLARRPRGLNVSAVCAVAITAALGGESAEARVVRLEAEVARLRSLLAEVGNLAGGRS